MSRRLSPPGAFFRAKMAQRRLASSLRLACRPLFEHGGNYSTPEASAPAEWTTHRRQAGSRLAGRPFKYSDNHFRQIVSCRDQMWSETFLHPHPLTHRVSRPPGACAGMMRAGCVRGVSTDSSTDLLNALQSSPIWEEVRTDFSDFDWDRMVDCLQGILEDAPHTKLQPRLDVNTLDEVFGKSKDEDDKFADESNKHMDTHPKSNSELTAYEIVLWGLARICSRRSDSR